MAEFIMSILCSSVWSSYRMQYSSSLPQQAWGCSVASCGLTTLLFALTLKSNSTPLVLKYQGPLLIIIAGLLVFTLQMLGAQADANWTIIIACYCVRLYASILSIVLAVLLSQQLELSLALLLGLCFACRYFFSPLTSFFSAINPGVLALATSYALICIVAAQAYFGNIRARQISVESQRRNLFALEGEVVVPAGVSSASLNKELADRCAVLAKRYQLSNRETEIFIQLARGSSLARIESDSHAFEEHREDACGAHLRETWDIVETAAGGRRVRATP